MKTTLTFAFLVVLSSLYAQKIERSLSNYKLKEAEVVLFTFGMDNPVKIGKVDKKGKLSVDLSEIQMPDLSSEDKDMFLSDLSFAFAVSCGGWEDFGSKGEIPAVKGGNISLWANDEYSGVFFLVSDEKLKPWLEDEGYNNAIAASFYQIIYVAEDVSLDFNCKTTNFENEKEIEVNYSFDIELKKGWNWVQYAIEEVYKTDPAVRASFPSRIKITNLQDPEMMKWIAKYFF